jgi:hypothetical protein
LLRNWITALFATGSGAHLLFDNFSPGHTQFHVIIPMAAVQPASGGLVARVTGEKTPALWVEHWIKDLGAYKRLLTPVPLSALRAEVGKDAVNLDFTETWGYTDAGDPLDGAIRVGCTFNAVPDSVRVPARLRTFLR